MKRFIITGLGNPGKTYEDTRHNIGFRIIKALAKKYGISFRPSLIRSKGSVGEGEILGQKVLLLLPLTYMNESGQAVRKCTSYYKIPIDHLMVVTDDVALPFGQVRLRTKGGSGGHNGLKSIEAHLGTQEYMRLRAGVGDRERGDLADHVLGRFTQKEKEDLPDLIDQAINALEIWITEGIEAAMQAANG